MADGWLTHAEYQAYGYEAVDAAAFPQFAARATLLIMETTHWRAAAARDDVSIHATLAGGDSE